MREGVNICRLNLAHCDREDHLAVIKRVREVAKKSPNRQVAIMLDTRGPVLRTGVFRPGVGKQITLEQGQELKLVADYSFLGDNSCIAISYDRLCTAVTTGGLILCADGASSLCVKSVHADHVVTEVMNSFQLGERKNCKLVA